jgi:hypothetical protein
MSSLKRVLGFCDLLAKVEAAAVMFEEVDDLVDNVSWLDWIHGWMRILVPVQGIARFIELGAEKR